MKMDEIIDYCTVFTVFRITVVQNATHILLPLSFASEANSLRILRTRLFR